MGFSCYHPLKAFQIGFNPSGKPKYKIVPYAVDHVELRAGKYIPVEVPYRSASSFRVIDEFIEIPCGKCIACRLRYSRDWANRCMLELESHDSAYFVTLTYNDEHVPVSYYGDPASGDALPVFTLVKNDLQRFIKRLRKAFPNDHIRYYACGEYGDNTYRPHYHLIIFGLHLEDLVLWKSSLQGHSYYTSDSLQAVWSDRGSNGKGICSPLGYVVVGNVTWDTCAYTARYVMKKLVGDESSFYDDFNIEKPFVLMSRKPGIGHDYYVSHPDIYDYMTINIPTSSGGKKFMPPKYFDTLFERDDPFRYAELKEIRKRMAEHSKELQLSRTDLDYESLLAVSEANHLSRIKTLKRSL